MSRRPFLVGLLGSSRSSGGFHTSMKMQIASGSMGTAMSSSDGHWETPSLDKQSTRAVGVRVVDRERP